MELLAGDKLGKYEVIGRLAAGGMAEVYLARSLGHGGFAKTVALKRMLPDLAAETGFREMFMQEAALAARLSHPHIVQIFDFAEERSELYLAMELVHGVTLKRLEADLRSRRDADPAGAPRASPFLAAHVARCIARALAHAWQAPDERGRPLHLIHRDVSPHNILLSYEGDVKLADFGIAKPAEVRTSVGVLKGKLQYMAPEQLRGEPLDARTDLFALGIVLYEAATGLRRPLFEAAAEDAVKQAVQSRLVPPPDRMDPAFPKGLSQVIMRALERDPARRFQSAAELAEALGEVIHKEAPGPQDYDLAAFMRRVYGEPPPVAAPRAPAAAPLAAQPRSELDRRADDPAAPTLNAAEAQRLRERAAQATSSRATEPQLVARPPAGKRWSVRAAAIAGFAIAALAVGAWAGRDARARAEEAAAAPPAAPAPVVAAPVAPLAQAVLAAEPPASGDTPREPGPASPDARAGAGEGGQPAAAPAVQPRPARERSAPAARPERRAPGTLVVYIKPWAFAWIDAEELTGKREQEAAPLLKRRVSAGRHVVHLQDGAGRTRDVNVVVPPEREVRVEGTIDELSVR